MLIVGKTLVMHYLVVDFASFHCSLDKHVLSYFACQGAEWVTNGLVVYIANTRRGRVRERRTALALRQQNVSLSRRLNSKEWGRTRMQIYMISREGANATWRIEFSLWRAHRQDTGGGARRSKMGQRKQDH